MSIKETLMNDLKTAMREKDGDTRSTLRMMQAAIKQVEVDGGKTLDDEGVLAVLTKQAKQRRESLATYEEAGREELAVTERTELAVIERYLPTLMSREEVEAVVKETVAQVGASGPGDMGKVMGRVMGQLKGKADGGLVNQVVKAVLLGQ